MDAIQPFNWTAVDLRLDDNQPRVLPRYAELRLAEALEDSPVVLGLVRTSPLTIDAHLTPVVPIARWNPNPMSDPGLPANARAQGFPVRRTANSCRPGQASHALERRRGSGRVFEVDGAVSRSGAGMARNEGGMAKCEHALSEVVELGGLEPPAF